MTKNLTSSTTTTGSGGGKWTLLAVGGMPSVDVLSFDTKDDALEHVRGEIIAGYSMWGAPQWETDALIVEVLGALDTQGVWRDNDGPMVIYLFEGGS